MQFLIAPFLWFFQAIWAKVGTFILLMSPFVIEKIFKVLGITFVTYVGLDFVIDEAESFVFNKFDNLAADLLQIMLLLKLDVGIQIMFASMIAAVTIRGTKKAKEVVFK